MKPKFRERSKPNEPIARLALTFKQRGKNYLQFAAALIFTSGTLTYIFINESGGKWITGETVLFFVLFSIPGILFLLAGLHFFTRKTETLLYKDRVLLATKTLFMLKPRISSYPMSDFNGVSAACERGKKITLNYVMVCHPEPSRSVVVAREFPSLDAAKRHRDALARKLQLPVIENEKGDNA